MLTLFSKECWTDIMRHSLVVILAVFLEVNAYNETPPVPGPGLLIWMIPAYPNGWSREYPYQPISKEVPR